MANTTDREDLRTRAKRRADMESSTFVSDAEWNDYINQGNSELYDILVTKYEDFFVKSTTFVDNRSDGIYTIGTTIITDNDVYKILGLDVAEGGSTIRMKKFSFAERNMYDNSVATLSGYENYRWHYQGNTIRIIPPDSKNTITVWYIPETAVLSADDTAIESVINRGWEEYIVIYAARKALLKEESDVSMLDKELAQMSRKIQEFAGNREAGESGKIIDVNQGTSNRWHNY